MCDKKYELIDTDSKDLGVFSIYRIRALKDFNGVKKGDLGGYVRSEDNLSHEGNCWIYDDAMVYGNAKVQDNASIRGKVGIYGNAIIRDNATITHNAKVYENAIVCNNAYIGMCSKVRGDTRISGYVIIEGNVIIDENAVISGYAAITDNALINENAIILGVSRVCGNSRVGKNALLRGKNDIVSITNIGSRGDTTTFFKTVDGGIGVVCGCFNGTIENFKNAVLKKHGDNIYGKSYMGIIKIVEDKFLSLEEIECDSPTPCVYGQQDSML